MSEEIKWLIGIGVTIMTTFGLTMIGTFRALSARVSSGDEKLHLRIENVRDKYVRRDDLDAHLKRIDDNVRDMRDEMRTNHEKLLSTLAARRPQQ